ncbi:MAG TPA: hypothetical protein VGH97_09710 [Thermoanaerobaculia bacterium]|jgi:hypothetical protein
MKAGRTAAAGALLLLLAVHANAQPVPPASIPSDATAHEWAFSLTGVGNFVPQDVDYGYGTFTADRSALHLEARYNYEAIETGSLWFGANFEFGKTVTFAVTPMLGGVFGRTNGIAPGYHLTVGWWKLELYSEGEYFVATDRGEPDYFYNWNELTISPLEWLRAGLVSQRTRVYQTGLDVQRGFLVGGTWKSWTLTVYVFNAGWTDPTTVVSLSWEF